MEYKNRKNPRLKDYDYSQNGCYFVTICTENRQEILSEVRRGGVLLRPIGKIVKNEISELMKRYDVEINPYVIMPDHIHMILKINHDVRRAEQSPAPTIGDIICTFKSLTTKISNKCDNCSGRKIWQRYYYDHIIRDEEDYITRCNYIENNPLKYMVEKEKSETE